MRIDPKSRELPLTPDQHFFVSCWFNMVNDHAGVRRWIVCRPLATKVNSDDASEVS
jgi:hypothetical protein